VGSWFWVRNNQRTAGPNRDPDGKRGNALVCWGCDNPSRGGGGGILVAKFCSRIKAHKWGVVEFRRQGSKKKKNKEGLKTGGGWGGVTFSGRLGGCGGRSYWVPGFWGSWVLKQKRGSGGGGFGLGVGNHAGSGGGGGRTNLLFFRAVVGVQKKFTKSAGTDPGGKTIISRRIQSNFLFC